MQTRLAIIPARGGSKRIPNKNIRNFCGKPIISYILDEAKKSGLFNTIHVSTDSKQIIKVVEDLGFKIDFVRPSDLADDYTPIMPVLKFVVEEYEKKGLLFDEVWMLMPCACLITATDLLNASDSYEESNQEIPFLTVCSYPAPVERGFKMIEENRLEPLNKAMFLHRSQDLEKKYFDTGSFAIYPMQIIKSCEDGLIDQGYKGWVLPKSKAVDIDDEEDWKIAEAIFSARNNS